MYQMAYDVVSNATLWFCFHHLFDLARRPRFDRHWREAWDGYRELNSQFADAVAEVAPEGAAVLVQDYHLMLVGRRLAQSRPDLRTAHFLHTPFADPHSLRVLPSDVSRDLLEGMAAFDSCGFHTKRWEASFRDCYADPQIARQLRTGGAPPTYVSALGPDPESLVAEVRSEACVAERARIAEAVGDRRLIVRVDRIELSKNILRGFWALEELLATKPHWRGGVVMLALAYPSREGLAEYIGYRHELEHTAARINESWGTNDWVPIIFETKDNYPRSVAALSSYDVLLVNPIRDGMNMVAKEGPLVNAVSGALVLSREAGAWDELEPAAIGINPFDVGETAQALDVALSMDTSERAAMASELRNLVSKRTGAAWLGDQLAAVGSLPLGAVTWEP